MDSLPLRAKLSARRIEAEEIAPSCKRSWRLFLTAPGDGTSGDALVLACSSQTRADEAKSVSAVLVGAWLEPAVTSGHDADLDEGEDATFLRVRQESLLDEHVQMLPIFIVFF
ncbi:MAG: hypothetical protein ABL959_07955, partial [Pyrinomonadaceae bacterium]